MFWSTNKIIKIVPVSKYIDLTVCVKLLGNIFMIKNKCTVNGFIILKVYRKVKR